MMKRPLLSILLLISFASASVVIEASERLHYRLSYSGLITGFFWKKLADVNFNLKPEDVKFRGEHACRLTIEVDTSGYLFAEMIHPVRYRLESTLTPNLQHTLLTRTIDSGVSDIHEAAWYDWENRTVSLFRKRKQIVSNRDFSNVEAEPPVWEKDIYEPVPDFIDSSTPIESGLGYLIQTKHFKAALSEAAIDPLAMIQRTRNHNFDQFGQLTMLVALDEELRHYYARLEDRTPLRVGGQLHHSALKIEISRASANGRKGAMHIWLSNDSKRLPLRIDIKAPLGMIHLELLQTDENFESNVCSPLRVVESK